jgi:putative hydrolase of the HAD superfamily
MAAKTLFFDAAGTLVHLRRPVGESYAQIAAGHGLETTAEVMDHAFRAAWKGSSAPLWPEGETSLDDDRSWWMGVVAVAFEQALGRPLDKNELRPLFEELYSHFARPEAWAVYEDVVPTLAALRERCRLFVLSNFDQRLRGILAGHGLDRYFEGMVISSEVGASKPHPRIFAAALKLAGAAPKDCLHVGDEQKADVEGAEAVGMAAYLVRRPERGLAGVLNGLR